MIEAGERVAVDFIGTLDNGSEFSNSYLVGEPFEFIMGTHTMLPVFEEAVSRLEAGEETTIRILPEDAYGEYDESLIEEVPMKYVPDAMKLPVGKYVEFGLPEGDVRVKVLKIEKGNVYLDHNHELAGKALNFTITLRERG